jgi:hypothetical protein
MAEQTNSKESTPKKDEDVAFRNESIATIRGLVHENKKLREAMSASAKQRKSTVSQRRGAGSRIQGLQTLQNTLGTPSKA